MKQPIDFSFHIILAYYLLATMAACTILWPLANKWLGTNLIHDFTVVTFSVKLTFFREKR